MEQKVSISELQKLEFKQAFQEFDKVLSSCMRGIKYFELSLGRQRNYFHKGAFTSDEIHGPEPN